MKAALENYSSKVINFFSGMTILASYKSYRWSSASNSDMVGRISLGRMKNLPCLAREIK
jgi:hypothetical protein